VRTLLVILSVLALGLSSCRGCKEEKAASPAPDAPARTAVEETAPEKGPADEEAPGAKPESGAEEAVGLDFEYAPEVLRVLRATEVRLMVSEVPDGVEVKGFRWVFDDGSKDALGAKVEHRFEDGLRDHRVRLVAELSDGRSLTTTRTLPLDRIPPSPKAKAEPEVRMPPPQPLTGEDALRVVLVGSLQPTSELEQRSKALLSLRPQVLFLLGDHVRVGPEDRPRAAWAPIATALLEPAAAQGTWVLPILGEIDLLGEGRMHAISFWQEQGAPAPLLPGSLFPESYAFRRDGVFFAALPSEMPNPDAEIMRLHGVLGRAKGDVSRLVLSHWPLSPLADGDDETLPRAYRFYEILARYGVTLFASGHHGITYLGDYGGLKTASVGRVDGECDALPDGTCTPPAAVVVDFEKGRRKRTFAVDLREPLSVYRTKKLPAVLLSYRRWDP